VSRFLADVRRGKGDYTTSAYRGLRGEPEPVSAEWLDALTATATTRREQFTMRSAAAHGIRILLAGGRVHDAARVKAQVAEALGCDPRTVERAAAEMPLHRQRGYRGQTTWQLLNSDTPTPTSESPISAGTLRQQIATRIVGERQSPTASTQQLAAELIADELRRLMNATELYERNGGAVKPARAPHAIDWRPGDGRAHDPRRQAWRQGPGHRITGHRPDY
jgi:hypothetical protein